MSATGAPQAALVGVAVSDAFEFIFDTTSQTRKCQNLRRSSRVALVFGGDDVQWTIQVEGIADEPTGQPLSAVKAVYFAVFPEGRERESWPGITYVRVRPTWMRLTDYRGGQERVELYPLEVP